MARFDIIPSGGGETPRYTGTPTFTGTYMKPGMLEFREVASPTPIDWSTGDYVEYSRTGFVYRLYSMPQVKKQARSGEYGGAFVYQNVQFFDDSKQLEICPFRDLVPDDNRIHFSTQPAISVFDNVAGIAERIQACLDDMYPGTWLVQVATGAMGASSELLALMDEDRDFSVSGVSVLGALDKVYEVWPEVGWTFSYDDETEKNILTIGGAGLSTTETYQYGKGLGLRSITRTVANADEMATRLYVYGSSRNMLPRWYNSQDIKDAESVDIQNLMLPVGAVQSMGYSGWGKTDNKPDAAKAFLDAPGAVMARLGLRPKTYYFDGTGDLPEIYPTIREMTIKDVRDSKSGPSAQYYPSTTAYPDGTVRVDTILSAQATFDSGLASDESGKANVESATLPFNAASTFTQPAGTTYYPFYHYQGDWLPEASGKMDVSAALNLDGYVQMDGIESVVVSVSVKYPSYQGGYLFSREYELPKDGENRVSLSGLEMVADGVRVDSATYQVFIDIAIKNVAQSESKTCTYSLSGGIGFGIQNYRAKTFKVSLRQIGFDINEQAALGNGKTIAMRSGKCAGRSFVIKSCNYVSASDSWALEVVRSEDTSLSQWFPNTDYPIVAGDEFVLLDISMPDEYILVAEKRLLAAAQELLADVSVERWQYLPEIDAKFMVENERVILPAQLMALSDANVVDGTDESILIDTVTIAEGEAPIPTYRVTLRDRKKKTFTEAKSADSMSSNPVTNSTNEAVKQLSTSNGESYFTLDGDGNITLKEAYQNLWVPGWLSAGGVGSGGGGGGGLISNVYTWQQLQALQSSPTDDTTSTANAASSYAMLQMLRNTYTKDVVDQMIASVTGFEYVIVDRLPAASADTMYKIYLAPATSSSTGNIKDEYITIYDSSTYKWEKIGSTAVDVTGKADKVSSATSGHLAGLDSSGNLTDSGYSPSDFALASSLSGYVTIGTAQTITGAKTFSSGTVTITNTNTNDNPTLLFVKRGNGFKWHIQNYTGFLHFIRYSTATDSDTEVINLSATAINPAGTITNGVSNVTCGRSNYRWGKVWAAEGDFNGAVAFSGLALGVYDGEQSWVIDPEGNGEFTTLTCYGGMWVYGNATFGTNSEVLVNNTIGGPNSIWLIGDDGAAVFSSVETEGIKIGNAYLTYDSRNKALHVYGTDSGITIGLYCDGWVSAGGIGSAGGGGGALESLNDVEISTPHSSGDLLRYNGTKWVNVPQSSIVPAITRTITGSGNAITDVTISGTAFTFTKGETFLTSVSLSIVTGADDLKAIEALTGTSGLLRKTAANTWSLDTNTYATTSSLSGYLPLTGGTLTGTGLSITPSTSSATTSRGLDFGSVAHFASSTGGSTGLYTTGTIYLRPGNGSQGSDYGIVLGYDTLTYNGNNIWHAGNLDPMRVYQATATGQYNYYWVKINNTNKWAGSFCVKIYDRYHFEIYEVGGYNYSTGWYEPRARLLQSTSRTSVNFYFGYTSANALWFAIPVVSTASGTVHRLMICDYNGNYLLEDRDFTCTITTEAPPATDAAEPDATWGTTQSVATLSTYLSTSTGVTVDTDQDISGTKTFTSGEVYIKTATSGTPTLIFQRGTLSDNYVDWKIQSAGGLLNFIYESAGTDNGKVSFHSSTIRPHNDTVTSKVSTMTLGTADQQWGNVYSSVGTFSSSLAVGGVAVTPSNYVTLNGTQEITGAKTFSTNNITLTGISLVPSADNTCYIGSTGNGGKRVNSAYIRNIYLSRLDFRDDSTGQTGYGYIGAGTNYYQFNFSTGSVNYMLYSDAGFFKQGGGVELGKSDHRWSTMYSVNANLSGTLTANSIVIGNATISYDTTAKGLKISGTDGGATVGFYCEGWVSAGGVGSSGGGVTGDYVSYGEAQSLSSSQKLQARTNIGVPTMVLLDREQELPATRDANTIYFIKVNQA